MTDLLANVSTLQSTLTRRRSTARLTQEMMKAEQEVSTGLKADVFGDLGEAAAESVLLRSQIDRNTAFTTTNSLLSGRMEVMAQSLGQIRSTGEDFLSLAAGNRDSPGALVAQLQDSAIAALDQITTTLNSRYQGNALFAGIDSDTVAVQNWTQPDADTGLSPADVLTSITGTGPTTQAQAQAMVAEIATVFDNTHANPDLHYEASFYNGTPALTAGGAPQERVVALIDEGVTLNYGVQANDAAFTDLMRGLTMLAAVDVSQISDPDAYAAYVTEAVDAISVGIGGVLAAETQLGAQQKLVEDTSTALEDVNDIYNSRILALEAVDPYEAATRLSQLETQLQSSYAVTARLMNLSLLNFLV